MEAGEKEAASEKSQAWTPSLHTGGYVLKQTLCKAGPTSLGCTFGQVLFLFIRALPLPLRGSFMGVSQCHSLGQETSQEQGMTPCLETVNAPCRCLVLEAHNNGCGMGERLFKLLFCIILFTVFHSATIQRLTNSYVCTKNGSLSRIIYQWCFQCCHLKT